MSRSRKLQVMFVSAFPCTGDFFDSYFFSYGMFGELIMKVSRAALWPLLAAHERGVLPLVGAAWGVTARKASHRRSRARSLAIGQSGVGCHCEKGEPQCK